MLTGLILALAAAAVYALLSGDETLTKQPVPSSAPERTGAPPPTGTAPRTSGADAFLPEVGDRAGDFTVAEVASSPHGFSVGYAGRTTVTGRVSFDAAAEAYCFEVAAEDTKKIPWSADEGAGPATFCFDDPEALPRAVKDLAKTHATATVEISDYTKEYYGIEVTDTAHFVRIVR